MDANSSEGASLPPQQIHLSTSSPGYSVPIRAPLTIDSDSEFCLSINGQIYSRTSSFNSSSSIDINSYGDEHTSVFEEENDAFVAYPDQEIVIERSNVEESCLIRPFVRYPDANYGQERCDFGESSIFRPFVKIPFEESGTADFGTKLSAPIAPLTGECDSYSDSEIDSIEGCRWDDSGWIPADGVVQKVTMAPKVRSFSGDEDVDDESQVEGVFSGDDIIGIENLTSVSIGNEGCKVECLNEVVKLFESDASSLDLERTDAQNVSSSNNEIEIEIINVKLSESDEQSFDSERIHAQNVLNSDSKIENLNSASTDSIKNEGCKVEYLNAVVKLSEWDASSFDLERIDTQTVPCEESSSADFSTKLSAPIAPLTGECDSESDIDSVDGCRWDDSGWIPADGVVQKVTMAPKVRTFSGGEGDDEVDDELRVDRVFSCDDIIGIENLSSVSIENEGCKVECLNEVVKFFESDSSSTDLERTDAQTVSSSNNEIEIESICVKLSESDELSFHPERIVAQIVSVSDSEIENLNSASIENEGGKVECLNEVVKLFESDASSRDLERIDAQTVSSSNNEIEIESINVKLLESDELSFDSERIVEQVVSNSDSEIENLNSASTESIENEGCKVECLNAVVKLFESDASSFDLERIDVQTVLSSNNEIETETINVELPESDEPSLNSETTDAQIVSTSESEIEIKTMNETKQEVISKKEEETLTKMQRVRAKFLRLALSEQLTTEVNGEGGNYKFDFNLTVLAIGKTGVGKSATINSIFGENKAITNAFDPGTTTIQEFTGNVDGIQLTVIDTPGLKRSSSDRSYNLRILKSIKRFTRKHTPNVVLYVDRLDTRDVDDSHLLTLITSSLGSSVWRSCIIALTHASCDLPNEPSEGFVVQRCRLIQEQFVSCGGNKRRMANPVWLVENHLSLACLDQANADDGCDQVPPFERSSEPRDICNRNVEVERKKAHFAEYGYRVKLLGTTHWSIGCRLCI